MVTINIIFLILFAGGAVIGYKKGALTQIGSVVAVAAAVIACRIAGPLAVSAAQAIIGADVPGASSTTSYTAPILGNGILFGVVWLGVWLITGFLRKSVYAVKIGIIDRVAGSVFLVLKWFMVVSLMLNLWKVISPGSRIFMSDEKLFGFVMELAPAMLGALKSLATNAAG